jgi:hypothetical protein
MKKSCFLQSVIFGTIIIAAVIYLVETKFNDWFLEPGKELVIDELVSDWESELSFVNNSAEKDSLKSLLIFYVDKIETLDEVVNLDEKSFLKEFDKVIEDSVISKTEISKLTMLMKKELNEKSKSN